MEYANHLSYESFEQPVRFRVLGMDDESIIPSYDITEQVFRANHGLTEQEFDVALFVEEARAEFAFDAFGVDASAVFEDVKELIRKYNEPPEDLSEDEKAEYLQKNVYIGDVDEI